MKKLHIYASHALRACLMLSLIAILGCTRDLCPGKQYENFEIINFSTNNVVLNQNGKFEMVADSNFYNVYSLFKTLTLTETKVIAQTNEIFDFSLINAAYACPPTISKSTGAIDSINIINKGSSIDLPSDLNSFFEISEYPTSGFIPVNEYSAEIPTYNNSPYLGKEWYLKYSGNISDSTIINFKITVVMTDGKEFLFENETMRLLPR